MLQELDAPGSQGEGPGQAGEGAPDHPFLTSTARRRPLERGRGGEARARACVCMCVRLCVYNIYFRVFGPPALSFCGAPLFFEDDGTR